MTDSRIRRDFLRRALRDGARAAVEGATAVRGARDSGIRALVDSTTPQPEIATGEAAAPWASPATSPAVPSDLVGLAHAAGLEEHLPAIQSLARISFRLTPAAAPTDGAACTSQRAIGVHVGPCEAELAGLASAGTFRLTLGEPVEEDVVDATATFEPGDGDARASAFGTSLAISPEWVLPRGWSALVDALGLDLEQQERWESLRLALAAAQGVEPVDATAGTHRLGRLFGYPDDRSGAMPGMCEARSRHRADANLTDADLARRWALLLQMPLPGGPAPTSAFFWVRENALRTMDLSEVLAIVR